MTADQPKAPARPKLEWDPVSHYQDIEVAERYDRVRFSGLSGRVFDALEKYNVRCAFAGIPTSAEVLDVPCGTGRLAETLLEQGYRVCGVDISGAMLEVAKRKLARFGDRFSTLVADVHELAREQPKRFDCALCARVLMHFPLDGQIRFLGAVARLSRGPVIFTQSLDTPYQRLRRRAKRPFSSWTPAGHPISEGELGGLLAGAGLRLRRRLRPMPLLTEEIIVVADPDGA
jgi:2-polyprenyl-3-methyl-5-hydroxy-6-metoxy-1,4-benzoquinol methylase